MYIYANKCQNMILLAHLTIRAYTVSVNVVNEAILLSVVSKQRTQLVLYTHSAIV